MQLAALVAVAAANCAAAIPWTKNTIPITGELVLTDVHAVYDAATGSVVALATGEAGVVLRLNESAASGPGGSWTTLRDTSFPTYWYGVYVFNATSYLLSGFIDGSGVAYGVIDFSYDGGTTWTNNSVLDPKDWGGGPIEFANASEGLMLSNSGSVVWRTSSGGLSPAAWVEVTPTPGNWWAGDYLYDGNGSVTIVGSAFCRSADFGAAWACGPAVDASGIDSAIACAGELCIVGGGEISPAVAGWVHVSKDGGATWGAGRALAAAFPIRSVLAIAVPGTAPPLLLAAGGNFFSGVGGIYSSADGGVTWGLDVDIGQEVKACRGVPLPPPLGVTRVFCVSAGQAGGGVYAADVKTA